LAPFTEHLNNVPHLNLPGIPLRDERIAPYLKVIITQLLNAATKSF